MYSELDWGGGEFFILNILKINRLKFYREKNKKRKI